MRILKKQQQKKKLTKEHNFENSQNSAFLNNSLYIICILCKVVLNYKKLIKNYGFDKVISYLVVFENFSTFKLFHNIKFS